MSDDSPRLYLILPPRADAKALARDLLPALQAGDVACLLIQSEGESAAAVRGLVDVCKPLCLRADTALLLDDAQLARELGCDGAHIAVRSGDPEEPVAAALKALKPALICGVGGVRTKHAAMAAGEQRDVDYIMFGEPAPDGFTPPLEQVVERTGWWSEIFNVPCVAYAPQLADAGALAAAGADFIALREAVWADPRGAAAAVGDAMMQIAAAPARIRAEPT